MRRAARMNINPGAEFREAPGGAGVIEMDMAEKDMPDIFSGKTSSLNLLDHVGKGRFRSRVEQDEPVLRFHRGDGDDAGPAELPCIENMDGHGAVSTEMGMVEKGELQGARLGAAEEKMGGGTKNLLTAATHL